MKIAIASDLHLEFGDIDLKNTEGADVLILAGDILIADDMYRHSVVAPGPYGSYEAAQVKRETHAMAAARYRAFLSRVNAEFPKTIAIAGNHEFYRGKWVGSIAALRNEYAAFDNITFMERNTAKIGDVVFVGGTLWTDCNKGDPLTQHALSDMMSDYTEIRNDELGYSKLRPATTMVRHQETKRYFEHVIRENRESTVVVVSHHAPTSLSIVDMYKDQFIMNGGYWSDLSDLILDNPNIALWVHGHMHSSLDYDVGSTRVVCNPRGYIGYEHRASDFTLKVVEI